jgi:hypothetical protein
MLLCGVGTTSQHLYYASNDMCVLFHFFKQWKWGGRGIIMCAWPEWKSNWGVEKKWQYSSGHYLELSRYG